VKEVEPLVDLPLETERAHLVVNEMVTTGHVRRHGLSTVTRDRMATSIGILEKVYAFPRRPTPEELYTDAYLPAAQDRAVA
jgi:NitT/TauT family transport system substrate-binding protein